MNQVAGSLKSGCLIHWSPGRYVIQPLAFIGAVVVHVTVCAWCWKHHESFNMKTNTVYIYIMNDSMSLFIFMFIMHIENTIGSGLYVLYLLLWDAFVGCNCFPFFKGFFDQKERKQTKKMKIRFNPINSWF